MILAVINFTVVNICLKYLKHIPAIELVIFRAGITLFISYLLLRWQKKNPWGNNKKLLVIRGLFGTAGLTLFFYTVQQLPLATAVTLQYLSPIFTLIVSAIWLKEYPQKVQWGLFLLAFLGVIVMQNDIAVTHSLALMAGIVSSFFSGCAYTTIRKLKNSEEALVIVFYFPLVTLPLVLPFAIHYWVMPVGIDWLLVACVGLFTQIAQVYMTKAYQMAKAYEVSAAKYFGIILSAIFGYLLFSESLGRETLLGMVLIMLSVGLNAQVNRANVKKA